MCYFMQIAQRLNYLLCSSFTRQLQSHAVDEFMEMSAKYEEEKDNFISMTSCIS